MFFLLLWNKNLLSYPQGSYKNLRTDLEDAVFCRSKRVWKTAFLLQQKLTHCILPQNVKKKYLLFSKEISGCSTKKEKTQTKNNPPKKPHQTKANQKYIHRTLKGERKCVIRERLRRPHPEDLWVKRNLPSSLKNDKKTMHSYLVDF